MRLYHFTTPECAIDILKCGALIPRVREGDEHMMGGKPAVWFTSDPLGNEPKPEWVAWTRERRPENLEELASGERHFVFGDGESGCIRLELTIGSHRIKGWRSYANKHVGLRDMPGAIVNTWWVAFAPIRLNGCDLEKTIIRGDPEKIAAMFREGGIAEAA